MSQKTAFFMRDYTNWRGEFF